MTRLVVLDQKFSFGMLFISIRSLPNLTSLIVRCLLSWGIRLNSIKENALDNHIRKVCLKKSTALKQIEYFIDLCPLMKYLGLGDIKYFNLESLIEFVLTKYP